MRSSHLRVTEAERRDADIERGKRESGELMLVSTQDPRRLAAQSPRASGRKVDLLFLKKASSLRHSCCCRLVSVPVSAARAREHVLRATPFLVLLLASACFCSAHAGNLKGSSIGIRSRASLT